MSAQTTPRTSRPVVLSLMVVAAVIVVVAIVLGAQWLRAVPSVVEFVEKYPGQPEIRAGVPVGIPAWLAWQHFFNVFFLILIVKSGLAIRNTGRPPVYWTRNNVGLLKTKNPPTKISINHWFHQTLDALWLTNGVIYVVLLIATGQWVRIVPTSWDVVPHAVSAALQYASLDWPTESGWTGYNGLQLLAYFVTVFVAAPLAVVTGIRLSSLWPDAGRAPQLAKIYPVALARTIHYPVMVYFVIFTVTHIALVLLTGARKNLNHMFAATDGDGWLGVIMFAIALAVFAASWFLTRPVILTFLAQPFGRVSRN